MTHGFNLKVRLAFDEEESCIEIEAEFKKEEDTAQDKKQRIFVRFYAEHEGSQRKGSSCRTCDFPQYRRLRQAWPTVGSQNGVRKDKYRCARTLRPSPL